MEQVKYFLFIIVAAVCSATLVFAVNDPECASFPLGEIVAIPHEYNCSLYYECFNGDKTLMKCDEGLWWNDDVKSCDFPENSGCDPGYYTCPNDDLGYYPYPNDCSKYIECRDGDSYLMNCPPGLWYSDWVTECVAPQYSDCGTWTTPHPICYGVRPGQILLLPVPGDCTRFYECIGSQFSIQQCPPGLYFDESRQMCDFPDLVHCDGPTTTEDPWGTTRPTTEGTTSEYTDPRCADGNSHYYPIENDCTRYIECYHGNDYLRECPPGLYYDEVSTTCIDPALSSCGKTTPTEGPTTTRDPNWTADPICPDDPNEEYLFPYPGDCTKYISCWRGDSHVMDCPPGLWFNPTIRDCDYPYEAGCEWGIKYMKKAVFNF